MSMRLPILIGAGSLGRDLVDCFGEEAFCGVYVDPQYTVVPIRRLPIYTSWEQVREITSHYVLGVADTGHRERARAGAMRVGLAPAPAMVARTAVIAADASLAPGTTVGHMAVVGPLARLAENVLVMHAGIVAHDSVIGTNSVLCAGVALGGNVVIGAHTFIGANAVLAPGVSFGERSYIAAGAACFRNGEAGSRWIGNPARRTFTAKHDTTIAGTLHHG
jgi:acetyltransferase-like isoleucine patch superfamily enzyme